VKGYTAAEGPGRSSSIDTCALMKMLTFLMARITVMVIVVVTAACKILLPAVIFRFCS
jgi:hypothetical protein